MNVKKFLLVLVLFGAAIALGILGITSGSLVPSAIGAVVSLVAYQIDPLE